MSQAAAGHLRVSERNIMYDYPCGVTSNFFFFLHFYPTKLFSLLHARGDVLSE